MKRNKKILIVLDIISIIAIAVIILVIKNTKSIKEPEEISTLDILQVFELENLQTQYEIEKIKDIQICSKYLTGTETYRLNANVEFEDSIGKMYYVRENYSNLNIYQTEYKIDEYDNINSQVEGIKDNFEEKCKRFLGIDYNEKGKEELLGESKSKAAIPLGESIYYENREYVKTYTLEDKKYEINFYRKHDKIVCELVYDI